MQAIYPIRKLNNINSENKVDFLLYLLKSNSQVQKIVFGSNIYKQFNIPCIMAEETVKFTKYEKARIIGSRALQISMGAPIMLDLSKEDLEKIRYNPVEIAKREFAEGVIPITIRRPLPRKVEE